MILEHHLPFCALSLYLPDVHCDLTFHTGLLATIDIKITVNGDVGTGRRIQPIRSIPNTFAGEKRILEAWHVGSRITANDSGMWSEYLSPD